ncbi:hypothetical protein [Mesorhizobium captivum]|uniref:hypothetical protein n=1 Tax=Mesorhizobium captivum TaxID=3072319 RepID=UPI002A24EC91|nr:hypothetical protein [Mesorhizobium sp. VK23E]MDX8513517.1 hypothetical protein [Mesorhizobium sp. VK23E]
MAQSYGSVAHPVDLGPFSRIVEVHWNSARYFAVPLGIIRASVVKNYPFPAEASGETVTSGKQPVDWTVDNEASPIPGTGPTGWTTYVTGFQYEYLGTPPGPGFAGFKKGNTGGWMPEPVDDIVGVPSLPDVRSLTPWSVLFAAFGNTQTVFSWWPRAEYQPLGGEPIPGLVTPHRDDIPFRSVTGATLQMRGMAFTDGPNQGGQFDVSRSPYESATHTVKNGTVPGFNPSTEEGIDHVFETLGIDVSAIVITYKGKTFRGIGAAFIPDADTIAPVTPGTLWVLTEKEDATP